ncbi:MAG: hypothetical protein KY432_07385 [Acidobacteria bacterium]|nr:hypothetical protein [Acidobacteriota bacterium]
MTDGEVYRFTHRLTGVAIARLVKQEGDFQRWSFLYTDTGRWTEGDEAILRCRLIRNVRHIARRRVS